MNLSYHTSPPHTPEHNGFYELCHRHIVETVLAFFLGPLFRFPSSHMPSSQLHISLIVFPYPHYKCPLHITNYSELLPITPNFMSLDVCVIHGFNRTRCINLLLDPTPVSYSTTRLLKVQISALVLPLPRPITPVMFVLLSQYFLCLLLILFSLNLMSPLFPHGLRSLLSTQPCL